MKLRVEKKDNYTVISNEIFRNQSLSLKAKGLLCIMLSLPDKWEYNEAGLASLSADGRTTIRSALRELEAAGYFSRRRKRVKGKFSEMEYVISEKPLSEKPRVENPHVDKPMSEKPTSENRTQLNTKELSKERIKRERVDYAEIVREYNEICTRLSRCSKITEKRKEHIKARIAQWGMDEMILAFRKANDSDFLCGKNKRGWKANFDWIMQNEENMTKVLEGRYDNSGGGSTHEKLEQAYMELQNERAGS